MSWGGKNEAEFLSFFIISLYIFYPIFSSSQIERIAHSRSTSVISAIDFQGTQQVLQDGFYSCWGISNGMPHRRTRRLSLERNTTS